MPTQKDIKPLFIMMCGLPHVGKSTVAEKLAMEHNCSIITLASVKEELFGKDYRNKSLDNKLLFRTTHNKIIELLSQGRNVIYVATNIKMKTRMNFLDKIKEIDCQKICYYVTKPFDQCYCDNAQREDPVKPEDLINMYYQFEMPYYYEGWDNIRISWTGRPKHSVRSLFRDEVEGLYNYTRLDGLKTYNVGKMLQTAKKLASDKGMPRNIVVAALFSEIAYPNIKRYNMPHEYNRTSAQDSIFYSCMSYSGLLRFVSSSYKVQRFCLDVAILIQWRDLFEKHPKDSIRLKYILSPEIIQDIVKLRDITDEAKILCDEI